MAQIGDPQRIITVEPCFIPVPGNEPDDLPVNVPLPAEPEEVPVNGYATSL